MVRLIEFGLIFNNINNNYRDKSERLPSIKTKYSHFGQRDEDVRESSTKLGLSLSVA